jgi:hypothetical protein
VYSIFIDLLKSKWLFTIIKAPLLLRINKNSHSLSTVSVANGGVGRRVTTGVCFQNALTTRYSSLQRPMNTRKQRLLDSLQVQQLFRDIEDEEAWIREKEPVAASTNRGEPLHHSRLGVCEGIEKASYKQESIKDRGGRFALIY